MWILASLFEGDPHRGTHKFCQILSFYICLFWKILSIQGEWFSFEFWRPCLRGIPSFWYPQTLSTFILSAFCLSWKFHQSSEVVKFWVLASLFEEEFFLLVRPNFVKFDLFFISAYPENFMCLAWVVKKLKFWRPRLRGTPHFDMPKFYLFFIFANPKTFMCLACVVRKFDFWRPYLRGTPILVLQIVLNFMFLLNLLTLKTLYVQL